MKSITPHVVRLSSVAVAALLSGTGPAFAAPAEAPAITQGTPDDGIPDIYFCPIKGQMGTDVHKSIYEEVVKDIKRVKPDLVVFTLNCADYNTIFYLGDDNPIEQSLNMLGEYREIVKLLREDLEEFPQVMWVEDSVGFGSLLALAWPDMYMTSTARLAGLEKVLQPVLSWRDPDVRAKMLAAWTGISKGFLEKGGYTQELGEAMMRPEKMLSVEFEGRTLKWRQDTGGQWVIDGSDKATAQFSAQLAEDIGLCKGLADTTDDLAFLLGYREYRKVPDSEKLVERYVEDWRRLFEQSTKWGLDYQDAMKNANGEDAVKYLGQAKSALEKIIGAMNKYQAIETRWRLTTGESKVSIEIKIEQIKEQIRGIKSSQKPGGSRGSGGGSGGGLSGGGGGRR